MTRLLLAGLLLAGGWYLLTEMDNGPSFRAAGGGAAPFRGPSAAGAVGAGALAGAAKIGG